MDVVSSELNINLTSKHKPRKQAIKWEDFNANIYQFIPAGKEQKLQTLLDKPEIFFEQECIEIDIEKFQESHNFPLLNYPLVFTSDIQQFSTLAKLYRKYFKKNIEHDAWEYYRDKLNKGVNLKTIENIFKFEAPEFQFYPVFIIHKSMISQLHHLALLEKTLGVHFFYCFSFQNKKTDKWLLDHHGNSIKSNKFLYHEKREDCSNLFPFWEKSKFSIIIDEINVRVSLFYYLFHLANKYDFNYITPYTVDENDNYIDNTQLITHDPLLKPSQFKQIQEVQSAFGGFCIVRSQLIQKHLWTENKFKDLCKKIKDKKIVFKL